MAKTVKWKKLDRILWVWVTYQNDVNTDDIVKLLGKESGELNNEELIELETEKNKDETNDVKSEVVSQIFNIKEMVETFCSITYWIRNEWLQNRMVP